MNAVSSRASSVGAAGAVSKTMSKSPPIATPYFVDVLCGYCYLADAHRAQLEADFGCDIRISYHFLSVFGDVRRRIENSGKSGRAYAAMVRELMNRSAQVEVCPTLFEANVPTSSVPAHLYLRAVKLLEEGGIIQLGEGPSPFEQLLRDIQRAFFRDGRDVSQRTVLDSLAKALGIDCEQVSCVIDNGRAHAELARDTALARKHKVTVTPTLVLGDDRELLAGNLGYDAIEPKVRAYVLGRAAADTLAVPHAQSPRG